MSSPMEGETRDQSGEITCPLSHPGQAAEQDLNLGCLAPEASLTVITT